LDINATLIGESISFIVFVMFCMKFVWPPILSVIEERQKKIEEGLAASDQAEQDLQLARDKATAKLKEAKTQAAEIIDQAKKRATMLVEEETKRGHDEREKIIAQGHTEIESERNRAKEDLRKQVSALAVMGAEKILERQIDAATHRDILDKLITEL
jgi:F-type H+-transporting ATPase subunit b